MSLLHLDQLTAQELRALPRDKTVFFFALGPIEEHGPHLPLGLDLTEARHCCELTAARMEKELPGWKAVLLPSLPCGVDSNTRDLALTVRGYVLRDWLVDVCSGLIRQGFLHFVCFSGHLGPRQLTAIEEASRLIRRQHGGGWLRRSVSGRRVPSLCSASSALVDRDTAFSSPFWPDAREHAGRRDTSLALAAGFDVPESFRSLPEARRPDSFLERAWLRWRRSVSGYWGSPASADRAEGDRIAKDAVAEVFPKLRAVWEGSDPTRIFRSGYSIFPSNGSYFKAWLYALALSGLISVWVYLNIRTMLD